jgi:hypothetical protein
MPICATVSLVTVAAGAHRKIVLCFIVFLLASADVQGWQGMVEAVPQPCR